jgi:hypothetical protein
VIQAELFFDEPIMPLQYEVQRAALEPLIGVPGTARSVWLAGDTLRLGNEHALPVLDAFVIQANQGAQVRDATTAVSLIVVTPSDVSSQSEVRILNYDQGSGKYEFQKIPELQREFGELGRIKQLDANNFLLLPSPRAQWSSQHEEVHLLSIAPPGSERKLSLTTYRLGVKTGVLTDAFIQGDTLYLARLWSPLERAWIDHSSNKTETEQISKSGLWTSICLLEDGQLFFSNAGYNNLLVEHPQQQLELYLADFDKNGEIDPIAIRNERGIRRTVFGLDEIAQQMPTVRKFFTSYLPFSSSSFDVMFPKDALEKATVLKAETLANAYLSANGEVLEYQKLSTKNAGKASPCDRTKAVRLIFHPELAGQ